MNKFFSLVLILAAMSNCGTRPKHKQPAPTVEPKADDGKDKTPDLTPVKTPPLGLLPTTDSMQDKLVAERCLSCHTTPTSKNKYIDLHDLEAIIQKGSGDPIPDALKNLIRIGCPDQSTFYSEIAEDAMPTNGVPKIDESDKKVIYEWILSLGKGLGVVNCNDEPADDETNPPITGIISLLN